MILADSSVWIDHFRTPNPQLQRLVANGKLYNHPFVTGELAAGSIQVRHRVISLLRGLPQLGVASETDFYTFIERENLNGLGLGFVDLHLLAAVKHAGGALLWTHDRRLEEQARRLDLNLDQ